MNTTYPFRVIVTWDYFRWNFHLEFWGLRVPIILDEFFPKITSSRLVDHVAHSKYEDDVGDYEELVKRLNHSVQSVGIYNFLREYMRKLRRIHGIFCKYYPYRKTFAKLQTVLDEMKSQRSILLATVARERFRVALLRG